MNNDIEAILWELGYSLKNEGSRFWRAKPVYRESSNVTSLRINKLNGTFIDFSANIKGGFDELVRLSLGLDDIKDATAWLDERQFNPESILINHRPKIKNDFKVNESFSSNLLRHYDYWTKKEISKCTLDDIECGICMSGKMNNRFVFVIRDEFGEIIGLAGRDLLDTRVKWKLMGKKNTWVYPERAEQHILESKSVYLVESIGDYLKLVEAGIKNVLIIFGVSMSNKLANYIASLPNLEKIIVATNNDNEKIKNWGEEAAKKIKTKLSKIVDVDKIEICLPKKNDWGDTPIEEIQEIL